VVVAGRCALDRGRTGIGRTNISLNISPGDDGGAEPLTRDAYLALPARAGRRVGVHRYESTVGAMGEGGRGCKCPRECLEGQKYGRRMMAEKGDGSAQHPAPPRRRSDGFGRTNCFSQLELTSWPCSAGPWCRRVPSEGAGDRWRWSRRWSEVKGKRWSAVVIGLSLSCERKIE
jgi:hypothetical protein